MLLSCGRWLGNIGHILPSWELLYVQLLMLLYFSAHPVTKTTRPSYLLSWHVSYLFSVLATFCSFVNHDTPYRLIDNWFWKQPLPSGLTATLHNFVMQSWTFWKIIKRLGQKWTHLGLEQFELTSITTWPAAQAYQSARPWGKKSAPSDGPLNILHHLQSLERIHDFGCTFAKPNRTSR